MIEAKNTSNIVIHNLGNIFKNNVFKLPIAILIGLFGEVNTLIYVLFGLVFLDIISGVCVAIKNKRFSSYGFSRAVWKLLAYIFVIFAVRLMEIGALNETTAFISLIIGMLCMTEGISVIENSVLLGVPLPKTVLKLMKNDNHYKAKKLRADGKNQQRLRLY